MRCYSVGVGRGVGPVGWCMYLTIRVGFNVGGGGGLSGTAACGLVGDDVLRYYRLW